MPKVRAVELLGSGSDEAHVRITLDDREQLDLTLHQDALRKLLHAARLPYLALQDQRAGTGRSTRMLMRVVEGARVGQPHVVIAEDARSLRDLYALALQVAGNYSVRTLVLKEYVSLQVGNSGLVLFDTLEGHRTWPRTDYKVVYDHAAQHALTADWCANWAEL